MFSPPREVVNVGGRGTCGSRTGQPAVLLGAAVAETTVRHLGLGTGAVPGREPGAADALPAGGRRGAPCRRAADFFDTTRGPACNPAVPTLLSVAIAMAPAQAVPEAPSGYGWLLLRALLALAAVCLLAYVVLKFLGKRVYGAAAGGGLMRVVARLPLEPRRSLYLVEVAGRYLLVGLGENGAPTTLAEIDAATVTASAPAAPSPSFLEVLRGRLRDRAGPGPAAPPPPKGEEP
jgi:flagellar protein FliO/FliZ